MSADIAPLSIGIRRTRMRFYSPFTPPDLKRSEDVPIGVAMLHAPEKKPLDITPDSSFADTRWKTPNLDTLWLKNSGRFEIYETHPGIVSNDTGK
jgi:hypothetical protein